MGFGSVAEKRTVRRDGGVASRMRLELLAEAHVEHLVRLVEDHRPEGGQVEGAALEVIAEASRRPHHHMGPRREGPRLPPGVHPADARGDPAAGAAEEPPELLLHLDGELPGRGDDEGEGRAGLPEPLPGPDGRVGEEEAEGDGLPGAGPGRDEEVPAGEGGVEHGGLDRRRLAEAAGGEGGEEGAVRTGRGEVHGGFLPDGGAARRSGAHLTPSRRSAPASLLPPRLPGA